MLYAVQQSKQTSNAEEVLKAAITRTQHFVTVGMDNPARSASKATGMRCCLRAKSRLADI